MIEAAAPRRPHPGPLPFNTVMATTTPHICVDKPDTHHDDKEAPSSPRPRLQRMIRGISESRMHSPIFRLI